MSPTQKQFWLYFVKGGHLIKEEKWDEMAAASPDVPHMDLHFPGPLLQSKSIHDHELLSLHQEKKYFACWFPTYLSFSQNSALISDFSRSHDFSNYCHPRQLSANQLIQLGFKDSHIYSQQMADPVHGLPNLEAMSPRGHHCQWI